VCIGLTDDKRTISDAQMLAGVGSSVTAQFTPGGAATPMQDALRLSMGSLMGFCRCEACEQVIGDLIDNLEDDFPGRTYQEGDVYALINDRFCYGVRWVFRSACRYILSKYMDETIQLLMMEATEREVCETLRFCW